MIAGRARRRDDSFQEVDGQAIRAINEALHPGMESWGATTAWGIMKLSHDPPQTRGGTLRRTFRAALRSYDSPARDGLQYPQRHLYGASPGARGKYGGISLK